MTYDRHKFQRPRFVVPNAGNQIARHALVVEDQPVLRRFIRMRLEEIGWQVRDAGDALRARSLFREMRPQLVTLDVVMPEAGGVTALDLLRSIRSESPRTVVHVLSSVLSRKDRQLFIDEGAATFSSKPFINAAEFKTLIEKSAALFEQLAAPSAAPTQKADAKARRTP
jgi:DNA-binding response OmpR family regulator